MKNHNMKILITGTIGSGKTTLIKEFEKEGHSVVHEQARRLIQEEQQRGSDMLPWIKAQEFQLTLLQRHIQSELLWHHSDKLVFFDTGFLDSLTFLRTDGFSDTPIEYLRASQLLDYDKVFVLEPLDSYVNDPQRPQSLAYAQKLHDMKTQVWKNEFGYDIELVPKMSVEERKKFIMEKVGLLRNVILTK